MDKREDDFNGELPEIPETLKGEPKNENEDENENDINKPEIEENREKSEDLPDLSNFLDENTEVESLADIDPDLDKALSEFADDGEKKEQYIKEDEEIVKQKKARKNKLIKQVSLICAIAVILIGGGLFAFWQIDKYNNSYVMTFENEKVTLEELKLIMILNIVFQQDSSTPKETAIDQLTSFMLLDKMAKERNIELPQEEKDYIKSYVEYIKEDLKNNNIQMPKVSDERFELILGSMVSDHIYTQLTEIITAESNFTVDEAAFASEFENYKLNDKLLKYIIVQTEEEAEEVKNVISSGELLPEEIIKQYSLYYDETYGIEKVDLSQIGLAEAENEKIMALNESEFSDAIDLGGMFAIFNVATDEETEEYYRESYVNYQNYLLFETQYSSWESESDIKMNDKAVDNFDENKFLEKFWESVASASAAVTEAAT